MQANSQKRRARKTALEFAGYVAPAVFFITLFVGIPFVMCIYYSFRKWNGIGKTSEFIGLENYIRLFTNDPAFVSALKYTFIYAIGTVLIVNVLAIFFAALLESKIKGRGFFRAASTDSVLNCKRLSSVKDEQFLNIYCIYPTFRVSTLSNIIDLRFCFPSNILSEYF